jgi:oligopeptide transport system substrate-binding protein
MAIFEGLVTEDPVDLHPVPGVAESWDISEDGLRYTFHLNAEAKWSNGDPVTAEDFRLSYKRMLTPTLASEYAYMLHYVVGAKEYNLGELTDFDQVGFRSADPHTFEVTLKQPTPFFLNLLVHPSWWPVHIPTVEKFGGLEKKGTRWTRPENLVGNGPFILKEWNFNQKIIVEKSPTYWDRSQVKLHQIHFYPIESQDTEERMYRSGQLHKTNEIPLSKLDSYRRDHPELLHIDPYLGIYFYRINTTIPPLDDPKVRRALALAMDRDSLVANVLKGGQKPALSFTPPNTAGYISNAQLQGGVEEARKLLAEAGYPNGEGFPTIELLYNTSESHKIIAEAIQQMWSSNLNIQAELVNQEWKVYLDTQKTLSYQVCRAGWIADYTDPHVFLEIFVTGGGNNDTGWSNLEYDDLLEKALTQTDQAERYEIYQRMEEILMNELPIIPIYVYTRPYLLHPSVKGHYPTNLDNHPYKYIYLEADSTKE